MKLLLYILLQDISFYLPTFSVCVQIVYTPFELSPVDWLTSVLIIDIVPLVFQKCSLHRELLTSKKYGDQPRGDQPRICMIRCKK